ncbi:MAG TPA: zinc-ribbon domain-containing protein, partial [Acidobacteriota bacterium]|nr:zinc-ribbon domain-containing protein [Acidobacteriota bacterium]
MTNFCPKCGTQQIPTNLLCFKCGALLPTSRPQPPQSPPQASLNPYIAPPPDQLTPGYPPPLPQTVNKSRATTSMILGLLSVPLLLLWGLG